MTAPNPDSVLDSIKKSLGLDPDNQAFDLEITMYVNSAFGSLQQLGAGPDGGFSIRDNTTLWQSYTPDREVLGMIKTFVSMSTRLAFDPPATSFAIGAFKDQIDQLAWRINVAVESAAVTDGLIISGGNAGTVFSSDNHVRSGSHRW